MRRNLESSHGLFFSQRLLLALVESGLPRDGAYRLVQGHAMRAWEEELDFPELVRADPEILRWCSEVMTVPCVAIGGITPENCAPLVAAGADFLAVISAVWDHPQGPGAGVKAFLTVIANAR